MDNHNHPAGPPSNDTAPQQGLPGAHSTPIQTMMEHAGVADDDHAVHSEGQHAGHNTAMFKNQF
ncbi:hypothetical protein AAGW05_12860 [Arthrobacter sp. LAPM80]